MSSTGTTQTPPTTETVEPGYDIILVGGQSNAAGFPDDGGYDEELDKGDDRIFMMDIQGTSSNPGAGNNAIVKAQHPIANGFDDDPYEDWHNEVSPPDPNTQISFVLDFAKSYANTYLAENRQVLIISNAIGGSSIESWVSGGKYMNGLIERLNIALELEGENRVVAMLWHQGEADSGMAEATCRDNLINVINTVRTAAKDANLPFIGGQTTSGGEICNTVWQKLIEEGYISNIGFASSVGAEHSSKESVHFSSAGYRFMAVKYFEQYQNIVSTNQEGGEGTTTTPPTTNENWQTAVVTDFKTAETGIPILSGNSISTGNATSEGFQYVVANDGVKAIRFKATFNESSLSAFDSVISILLGEDTNNYYAMNVAAFRDGYKFLGYKKITQGGAALTPTILENGFTLNNYQGLTSGSYVEIRIDNGKLILSVSIDGQTYNRVIEESFSNYAADFKLTGATEKGVTFENSPVGVIFHLDVEITDVTVLK